MSFDDLCVNFGGNALACGYVICVCELLATCLVDQRSEMKLPTGW